MDDQIKRALGLHQSMGNDLAKLGGLLRCKECNYEMPLTADDIAKYLAHGWPKCEKCKSNMRWLTQKELDSERDMLPDADDDLLMPVLVVDVKDTDLPLMYLAGPEEVSDGLLLILGENNDWHDWENLNITITRGLMEKTKFDTLEPWEP